MVPKQYTRVHCCIRRRFWLITKAIKCYLPRHIHKPIINAGYIKLWNDNGEHIGQYCEIMIKCALIIFSFRFQNVSAVSVIDTSNHSAAFSSLMLHINAFYTCCQFDVLHDLSGNSDLNPIAEKSIHFSESDSAHARKRVHNATTTTTGIWKLLRTHLQGLDYTAYVMWTPGTNAGRRGGMRNNVRNFHDIMNRVMNHKRRRRWGVICLLNAIANDYPDFVPLIYMTSDIMWLVQIEEIMTLTYTNIREKSWPLTSTWANLKNLPCNVRFQPNTRHLLCLRFLSVMRYE